MKNSDLSMKGKSAIVGLGMTEMGKVYGKTPMEFAVEAVARAVDDCGIDKSEIDGLLINSGVCGMIPGFDGALDITLQNALGLYDLKLLNVMNSFGSTAGAMIQYASMACIAGTVRTVVCVFADSPLREGGSAWADYGMSFPVTGLKSLEQAHGLFGFATNQKYAMAARRHMELYGTTSEQLGAIAVSQREWARMNPHAYFREPITIRDHQASRMISDPFHLLDCCLVSNGGVAVIVTSAERAADLKQKPVFVLGWGQGHPGQREDGMTRTGAAVSGEIAFAMAGISPGEIDFCELYDCYTYTVLVTLEDYGFCRKGEGGSFVEGGRTGPGGELPVNTGGGQLSSYYMWGMTPVSEAVIQVRGQARERQVESHDLALVSGNGGVLEYHSTLIVGNQPG